MSCRATAAWRSSAPVLVTVACIVCVPVWTASVPVRCLAATLLRYKKQKSVCEKQGGCEMGGFTRLLHSGHADDLMDEIPTMVVDPLPQDMVEHSWWVPGWVAGRRAGGRAPCRDHKGHPALTGYWQVKDWLIEYRTSELQSRTPFLINKILCHTGKKKFTVGTEGFFVTFCLLMFAQFFFVCRRKGQCALAIPQYGCCCP